MNSQLLFYAWSMKIFSESTGLCIPKEIILSIVSIIKSTKNKIKFTYQGKYFIIMRDKCLAILRDDWTNNRQLMIHMVRKYIIYMNKNYFYPRFCYQNNWYYTRSPFFRCGFNIYITKCNNIIYCDSNGNEFIVPNLGEKVKKIYTYQFDILIVKKSGETIKMMFNEIFMEEEILPIKNINKMIVRWGVIMIIDNDGNAFQSKSERLDKYYKIRISNVINIYAHPEFFCSSYGNYIFLTKNGDIYSCGNNKHCILGLGHLNGVKFTKPEKINLRNVSAVHMDDKYVFALTHSYDLYVWGNITYCQEYFDHPILSGEDNRIICSMPILICRITFDISLNYFVTEYIQYENHQ